MHIIVLIKQVPEIEKVKFNYEKGHLDRGSAAAVINPFDLNALEAAVQLKENLGGIVTAVSMGPRQAENSLKDAVARGADRAVLLNDQRFAGSDTLATSYTLASAIKKLGAFDLVICGEKTVDGDTAQVGPEVAEFLSIPHVAYVDEIKDVKENKITVKSRMEKNYYIIELVLPALITVTKDANTPRLPTFRDKLKARKTDVTVWSAADLASTDQINYFGSTGSPTSVVKIYAPSTEKRRCQIIEGPPETVAKKIVGVLREIKALK
ncbi:MAG: electron transfer flavoprotein subunit beta/FixA family protein [Candidatus Bathyarchaeia archaeon]